MNLMRMNNDLFFFFIKKIEMILPENFIIDFEIRFHHLDELQKTELTEKFIEKGIQHLRDEKNYVFSLKSFEYALRVYESKNHGMKNDSMIYFIKMLMNDVCDELGLELIYPNNFYINSYEKNEMMRLSNRFGVSERIKNNICGLVVEEFWEKFNGC